MAISPSLDKKLHHKLPIDADEKILGVYRHHWFAYASSWIFGAIIDLVFIALAVIFTIISKQADVTSQYNSEIFAGVAVFCAFVLLAMCIPVWLKSQEQLVLTEEALSQILQPTLFVSRVDQMSLQHIASMAVRQDFLGTMLGYGHITIETQGEQDDYQFYMVGHPHEVVREITSAKENYEAALNAGRIPSTLGSIQQGQDPSVDNEQYQQFLKWQAQSQQQASPAAAAAPAESQPQPQPPVDPDTNTQQ